jgi:hypothetical protein
MRTRNIVIMLLLIVWAFPVRARGGGHRSSGSSSGPKSTYVHGYTRKDGTYVAPHYRSAPGTASSTSTPTTKSWTKTSTPATTERMQRVKRADARDQGYLPAWDCHKPQ